MLKLFGRILESILNNSNIDKILWVCFKDFIDTLLKIKPLHKYIFYAVDKFTCRHNEILDKNFEKFNDDINDLKHDIEDLVDRVHTFHDDTLDLIIKNVKDNHSSLSLNIKHMLFDDVPLQDQLYSLIQKLN